MNEKYWDLVENLGHDQSTIQSKVNESVSKLAISMAKKVVKKWIENRKNKQKKG
jgi:flagellar biosynthesis/type III secretory pathway protein FliH